jgi:hypothetical protein
MPGASFKGQKTSRPKGKAQGKKKSLLKEAPILDCEEGILGGFGTGPVLGPEDLYRNFPMARSGASGGNGSVTTKRELGIKLTDFFDYTTLDPTAGGVAQFVNNYFWEVNQNLLDTNPSVPGGQENTFCRVRKLCVWVMPLCRTFSTGAAQPQDNASAMMTVNCQVPGVGTQYSSTTSAYATNTQTTNVLPTINPKWKRVFTVDLQKTFQSGVIRPWFASDFPSQQCLFQMSIVEPISGKPYLTGDEQVPIRVKVQLHLDQPISTFQNAELLIFKNEEFVNPSEEQNGAAYSGTVERYVQLDLEAVRDNLK